MKGASKELAGLLLRLAVTAAALGWIFRSIDLRRVSEIFRSARVSWLLAALALFSLSLAACITRWKLLAPAHRALTWPYLANSYLVGAFFNLFLPTTVGGDVIRGYDLIKATGEWKGSLASVLVDRLLGLVGFLMFALGAWIAFPPAREDPLVRGAFGGFCLVVAGTLGVLGSRKVLQSMLTPFSKIGLGQLQSHAAQFQEALRAYLKKPKVLVGGAAMTLLAQTSGILMFWTACKALGLAVSLTYLVLVIPIIVTVSQIPLSLNGLGIREGATVLFLGRIGITQEQSVALSLLCGLLIPMVPALLGAVLFLLRRRRKPSRE